MVDQEGVSTSVDSRTVLKPSGSAERNARCLLQALLDPKSEFFLVALKCSPVSCKSFCLNLRRQTPASWGLAIPSTRMPWST